MQAGEQEKKKPKKKQNSVGAMLAGMFIGGLAGFGGVWFATEMLPELDLSAGQAVLLIALLLLLLPLLVAVHEAGHLLGGRLAGFQALLFLVGPLRVERVEGRLRVTVNRKVSLFGGLAVSTPRDAHDLRRRTMMMIAGGPGMNLLTGALFLGLWAVLFSGARPADPSFGHVLSSVLLSAAGFFSLALGIMALIPGEASGFASDGARILRLLRPGPIADRDVAVTAITGASIGGRRPREWDASLVGQAIALQDEAPFRIAALQLAALYELDCGRPDAARAHLEAALAGEEIFPPLARPGLLLQAAYFIAAHDGDAARARALLDRAGPGLMIPEHQRMLAEGAVRLAEGDAAEARRLAEAALEKLPLAIDAGSARMAEDQARALSRQAEARLAAPAPAAVVASPGTAGV